MNRTKFLIVDDELVLAHSIASMLQSLGFTQFTIEASFSGAVKRIEQGIDVAILDINLGKGAEGIELGRICSSNRIPFIYISSYSDKETLDNALHFNPSAYLVKPITEANLYVTLQLLLVRQQQDRGQQMLEFKDGTEWIHLPIEKVLYLKSENVYVNVVTEHKTYLYRGSLQSLLQKVPVNSLIQTHRSYAINPIHIERMGANYLKIGQIEIPISRNFKHLVQHS